MAAEYSNINLGTPGLAAYWRLGESSGTDIADASSHGHDGPLEGSYTLGQDDAITGDPDTSILFAGGSATTGLLSGISRSALTFECWLQFSGNPGLRSVIGFRSGNYGVFLALLDGPLLFMRAQQLFGTTDLVAAVAPGAWHHVAAVLADSSQRLYLDGALAASATDAYGPMYWGGASVPFAIGNSGPGNPDQPFPGLVDEVAVYDRALTAQEIATRYRAGVDLHLPPTQGGFGL